MKFLEIIRENKEELRRRFGIQRIGTVEAQGHREHDRARVNLIIEFGEITTDLFLEAKTFLEGLFGKDVDIATFKVQLQQIHPLAGREITWLEEADSD